MRYITCIVICVISIQAFSQSSDAEFDGKSWNPPYTLPITQAWDVERFIVPPGFALQIQYKGIEDIRFTPGWANAKSAEYWSYAFLWFLDGFPKINEKTLQIDLMAYYTGLIKSNLAPEKIPVADLTETKTMVRKVKTASGDVKTFSGTIEMLDYMQLKPIVLNCLIHLKTYPSKKKTIIFFELSPKSFSDPVWTSLNQLWSDFVYE